MNQQPEYAVRPHSDRGQPLRKAHPTHITASMEAAHS